jgi:LEA14-like dessication related protein
MTARSSVRTHQRFRVAFLAATAFVASGCAALGRATFKEPVVTLREVAITGLGLSGGNVDVVLSVYNPNAFNLDALGMTYRVDIDSVPLGSGQLGQRFVVQQGDSSIVRLPISFTYAGIGAAGRQLMQSGAVSYRVRGDFTVGTPLGNFTRPYDQTGRYSTMMGNRR